MNRPLSVLVPCLFLSFTLSARADLMLTTTLPAADSPGSAIRGHLVSVPEPRSLFLLGGCLAIFGVVRCFRKQ